ncbi:hypothetical protein QWA_08651 [Alcaligenes faecalis subsp. faecalis NCIB 8687]|nr:hypothetical protein QWA_08651 [Alcaligenes faecalis subsp. faecalis NCIB 8687]
MAGRVFKARNSVCTEEPLKWRKQFVEPEAFRLARRALHEKMTLSQCGENIADCFKWTLIVLNRRAVLLNGAWAGVLKV